MLKRLRLEIKYLTAIPASTVCEPAVPTKHTRIMYIEDKSGGLEGLARIGRVTFSKSRQSLTYAGRELMRTKGGYKYNHFDSATLAHFWISGPKKRGGDRLYGIGRVDIDDDVRAEYWTHIRSQPERSHLSSYLDR